MSVWTTKVQVPCLWTDFNQFFPGIFFPDFFFQLEMFLKISINCIIFNNSYKQQVTIKSTRSKLPFLPLFHWNKRREFFSGRQTIYGKAPNLPTKRHTSYTRLGPKLLKSTIYCSHDVLNLIIESFTTNQVKIHIKIQFWYYLLLHIMQNLTSSISTMQCENLKFCNY